MTVPELISTLLEQLRNQFYQDKSPRDFKRDERFLIGAIGTYGYECARRGWEFDVPFMYRELCELLLSFKRSGTAIEWMPLYLQGSIRRSIGLRAEKLQVQARAVAPLAAKIVAGVKGVTAIERPTNAQLMAAVYQDVRKLRRRTAAARRQKTAEERKQEELL